MYGSFIFLFINNRVCSRIISTADIHCAFKRREEKIPVLFEFDNSLSTFFCVRDCYYPQTMLAMQFIIVLTVVAYLQLSSCFQTNLKRAVSSKSALSYSFFPFKKTDNEKKDPKRLLKNILFPGIYREYVS